MIEDREYLKRDLARIYTPHTRQAKSAMKKLREDINRCWELKEELEKLPSYNIHAGEFPKEQVKLIIDFLGEP